MVICYSSFGKLIQRGKRGANYPGNIDQPFVAVSLQARDKLLYLASVLPFLRIPSTQHVLGEQSQKRGTYFPFDQVDVDFVQLWRYTSHRN